jgi:hypothetical protein
MWQSTAVQVGHAGVANSRKKEKCDRCRIAGQSFPDQTSRPLKCLRMSVLGYWAETEQKTRLRIQATSSAHRSLLASGQIVQFGVERLRSYP